MSKFLDDNGVIQLTEDIKGYIDTGIHTKQDELVSGTNIKSINGNSLLGSGDLTISGGSSIKSITVSVTSLFPNLQDMSTFLQTFSSSSDAYLNAVTINIPGIDNTYDEIIIDIHPITQPPYNITQYDGTIICRKTMSTTVNAMYEFVDSSVITSAPSSSLEVISPTTLTL